MFLGFLCPEKLSPRTREELHVSLENGGDQNGDIHSEGLDAELDQYCEEYDKDTKDVLNVEFPPWYFSTHGLSRPSTPVEADKKR